MGKCLFFLNECICVSLYQAAAAEFVFVPTEKEKSGRVFHLRYTSTKDHYCRVSNDSEDIQGWDKTVWRKESVFRKLENDWHMVSFYP